MGKRGASAHLLVGVGVGLAFGTLVSLVNVSGIAVLPKVIGDGWSWAAVGIVAAALAPRRPVVIVLLTLTGAVASYYVSDLLFGRYTVGDFSDPQSLPDPGNVPETTDWIGATKDFMLWSLAATVVCWPLSKIGVTTRRNDWWGLAARLVVPLGALVEVLGWRLPVELAIQPSALTVATYLSIALLALTAIVLLTSAHVRRIRPRTNQSAVPNPR